MTSLIRKPFRYSFKNATFAIILINAAIFFIQQVIPSLRFILSLNVYNCIAGKMYWQPFTYMFVHGNFQHVFFNMLGLFFFGLAIERALGTKEFLLLYLLVGTLCGIFSLAVYYFTGQWRIILLGASGAVYGILLAYAVVFPKNRIFIWGLIPVPAPILVLGYAIIEFFSHFFGMRTGVAHSVHLAGFGFCWLYFVVRMGINPIKVWKNAYF